MSPRTRRRFLRHSLASGAAFTGAGLSTAQEAGCRIAPFRFDVTPPAGHPLCGGWITPVKTVADSLEAIGFVLLGAGAPIVVCAVDWTGILNEGHVAWRMALAEAAGTTPDRVAVQCVHQHDAPFACPASEKLLAGQKAGLTCVDPAFFQSCLDRGQAAIRAALPLAKPVTHVAASEARVDRVAGNRRLDIGPDGRVRRMRGSACNVPELIALPEGLIDPMLKTVAFFNGKEKLVSCHYYATHPMSHYGRGEVSSDFVGLARKRRQKDDPGCAHIYFTGCAGNVAAGKYNDGSAEARVQLTERIHQAIVDSEKALVPAPIRKVAWATHDLLPAPNPVFTFESQLAMLQDAKAVPANRIRPAMRVAWLRRLEAGIPIILSALRVNDLSLLHLPAECFVEYQIRAQQLAPDRFVATAAYGDGGTWYVPTKEAFPQGGYEVSVANSAPETDDLLTAGIRDLLGIA